ncbi:MAG: hypothetical protein I3274_04145 [Candidatus Moeniiplasma glomeromycotorum]|nr:hypothetical protein [Candidatus Moeniiplasma glomeromycotorum]MCE8167870.1 hypothetical protein [Candidatus Moeniiplasma glomeromycotorum]
MEITNQKCEQCQISLNNLNLAKEKIKELEKNEKLWKDEQKNLQEKVNQFTTNFWEICPKKTKTDILDLLIFRLGKPKNELDNNCLNAVAKKVLYFYSEEKDSRSQSVSSLIGQVSEITQKQFKEGKRMGQIYYQLKLENKMILRAAKEDLSEENWSRIVKLELLDQKLLFKYRKWIVHKDIVDFEPVQSEPNSQP